MIYFFDINLICKINQIENQNAQFENYEKQPQKRYIVLQWWVILVLQPLLVVKAISSWVFNLPRVPSLSSLQQKVSMYAKWFTGLANRD